MAPRRHSLPDEDGGVNVRIVEDIRSIERDTDGLLDEIMK